MVTENAVGAESGEIRTKRRLTKGCKGASRYTNNVISERTFYHLVEIGQIPVIRLGKSLYFDLDDIDAALQPGATNG